jgi:arginine kinase
LKNSKDNEGFSFKQAIFSGSKNTDSGIGVYAGSHDSYHTFAPLMDKIIEDYHGHKKGDKHTSNMDYKLLNAPALTGDDALLIKSTRIRVGRNLAKYPLGPGVNNDQRYEIEQKIIKALTSFTGELAGKYYALTSLTDKERKQLIEDHFLFKEGDRFLEACGLNKDWPHGRGIFHNDAKTFLVWVNEED